MKFKGIYIHNRKRVAAIVLGLSLAMTCAACAASPPSGSTDSTNYATFDEMVAVYAADIAEIEAGDQDGNDIVNLYDPLRYIGAEEIDRPVWARIVMGASEGDISLFNSLNLEIACLNAGIPAEIEWQWDTGHVPNEVLWNSFSLCVGEMYGKYVEGALQITRPQAEMQTTNDDAAKPSGTGITSWVDSEDMANVNIIFADAAAYRTADAGRAMPAFDVIDCGREDYVFGRTTHDARHWDSHVLEVFEKYKDILAPLFNQSS